MNAENFSEYLNNPSHLYHISYQELKSLVLQYPYCQNLHYLLLLKSQIDQHQDTAKNLEKAAAYSIDRNFLYKKLKAGESSTEAAARFTLEEDFLELKDLKSFSENMKEELKSLSAEAYDNVPAPGSEPAADLGVASPITNSEEVVDEEPIFPKLDLQEKAVESTPSDAQEEENIAEPIDIELSTEEPEEMAPPLDLSLDAEEQEEEEVVTIASIQESNEAETNELEQEEEALVLAPISKAVEIPLEISDSTTTEQEDILEPALAPPALAPSPKPSFTNWVQQFQSAQIRNRLGDLMESRKLEEKKLAKKKAKKKKKNKKQDPDKLVPVFAAKSIQDGEDLASETLAKLLTRQKQYGKAIKVYERLLHRFPADRQVDAWTAQIEVLKTLNEEL